MVSWRNHRLYHFSITIYLTSPVFTQKNTFEKNLAREVLIEQIIEFELRSPGPPGRTCTSTTGKFHEKTKISEENLRVDDYEVFTARILQKVVHLTSPYLCQITYKI